MQRFVISSSRWAPRTLTRLSTAGHSQLAALIACQRLFTPVQMPFSSRTVASEAVARQQSLADSSEKKELLAAESSGLDNKPSENSDQYIPVPFDSYKSIDKRTLKAIKSVMKFENASKVQHQIISQMPIEKDLMVKAKTGTGKTTAFLVPAIETLLREYAKDPERSAKGRSVGCLIISPTRELAKQIATEAEKLVTYYGWNVQLLVGGESSREQLNKLRYKRSDIVIGTPGRVMDFLQTQPVFAQQAEKTGLLVFDEADVLLQMGFQKEVEFIVGRVPKERQTFLVSATLDSKIRRLAQTVFHRGFDLIDCVDKGETNTHHNVKQEYVEAEFSDHFPLICDIIQSHIDRNKAENHGSKIVVFMPTVKSADLYGQVIRSLMRKGSMQTNMSSRMGNRFGSYNRRPDPRRQSGEIVYVSVLHGKLAQNRRSRISDEFRNFPVTAGNTSILVTTDVSARGVDYPNVSMVLQVGIPSETDAYVHRLGRTGRAGKSGEGVILLSPLETKFLRALKDTPIVKSEKYTAEYIEELSAFEADSVKHLASRWEAVTTNSDPTEVQDTYVSLVAFYAAHAAMICDPRKSEIIDGPLSLLAPFKVEKPRLPSSLGFSSRNERSSRGSSGDRSGGRGFGSSGGSRGYGSSRGSFGNGSERGGRGYNSSRGSFGNSSERGSRGYDSSRGSRGYDSARSDYQRSNNRGFGSEDKGGSSRFSRDWDTQDQPKKYDHDNRNRASWMKRGSNSSRR
ncbi:hypothetical protein H4R99_003871 [Coemansia sp. RSA 1722]|nr:hypothetical protein H4R99_003871 [Coemansia sp. RSA 1722]KAJ2599653.1 hypothetical protein GGF39_002139 [Coemansia sp. RSA 1721]